MILRPWGLEKFSNLLIDILNILRRGAKLLAASLLGNLCQHIGVSLTAIGNSEDPNSLR